MSAESGGLIAITGVSGLGNVFTHFSIIPTIWVVSRKMNRYFVYYIIVLFMYFASTEAHICEVFYNYGCPIDISWLWFIDNIGAEGLLLATDTIIIKFKKLEQEIATQLVLIIFLVFYKTMTDTNYFSGAITLGFIIYGYCVNSYRLRYFIPGNVCAVIGLGVFFFLGFEKYKKYYFQLHPIWHVLIFVSVPLNLLGCEDEDPEIEAILDVMPSTQHIREKKAFNNEIRSKIASLKGFLPDQEDENTKKFREELHSLDQLMYSLSPPPYSDETEKNK